MDSRIFCSVKKVCPKYFSDYCTVDQFHVIFSKWEWIFILKHCLIFSYQDILLWLLTKRFMIKYNALIFMAFLKNCPLCFHCIFQGKVKEVFWTRRLPIYYLTVWKNKKFPLTKKVFREINSLVTSIDKTLLSRNFCQKSVRENYNNFHTVYLTNNTTVETFHGTKD